ncbi:peptidylprolyl isomerase [Winogradskyella maritima]|uniref:Peptidylprolyl isomerase n=1 Tax=Winogradskyella maritima TaxID=1517766 RepID=A0ABV8AM55_9FLAO|nr:peptidylprolyl isomerase [Winogradskyella maritima]
MKSLIKTMVFALMAIGFQILQAQEIINDEEKKVEVKTPVKLGNRIKADGVAAVVGDYIILDSDLDRRIDQLEVQGADLSEVTRCQLFGSLLEEKLYAHQAIQDSIIVNELQMRSQTEQQIQSFLAQPNVDGIEDLLEIFKKDNEADLREEMYEINKNRALSSQMREKIIADIEITPEEVRQFYNELKEDGLPTFGTELNVANIVIIPEVTEEAKQDAVDRLKEMRTDILENGASFNTKALFYSMDGSKNNGGKLGVMNRKNPRMVKEFRDVVFSMQEGDISEPFETDFGYHIVWLEAIRGQDYEVRHILLRPELSQEAIQKAKDEIDEVRQKLIEGKITFAEAAREFSDEEETKFEGGKLTNPLTQDFNFELTKMEPEIYAQIQDLEDGEISEVLEDGDRLNPFKFKLVTVTNRIDEHEADFSRDYLKIKRLALQSKHFDAVGEWQEETIMSTYIKINGEYRSCEFTSNWLKNE